MADDEEHARSLLGAFACAPRGFERERMDASADRLREALQRSLMDARAIVSAIAQHNRETIGLSAWAQPLTLCTP